MAGNGSPGVRESGGPATGQAQVQAVGGRWGRRVDRDVLKHTPERKGIAWDDMLERGNGWKVVEFDSPTVQAPSPSVEPPIRAVASDHPVPATEAEAPWKVATTSRVPRKFEWLEALRGRTNLTPREYRVLVTLATYADADLSGARPGHARLAADCGYGGPNAGNTVGSVVRALCAKGYVAVVRRGTNVRGNLASEYRVTVPEWEAEV